MLAAIHDFACKNRNAEVIFIFICDVLNRQGLLFFASSLDQRSVLVARGRSGAKHFPPGEILRNFQELINDIFLKSF